MVSQSKKRTSKQYPRLEADYLIWKEGENITSVRKDSLFAELLPPKILRWVRKKRLKLKKPQE